MTNIILTLSSNRQFYPHFQASWCRTCVLLLCPKQVECKFASMRWGPPLRWEKVSHQIALWLIHQLCTLTSARGRDHVRLTSSFSAPFQNSDAMLYTPSANSVKVSSRSRASGVLVLFASDSYAHRSSLQRPFFLWRAWTNWTTKTHQSFIVILCSETLSSLLQKECKNMSLRCYMLELIVVISEEEIINHNADCISDFHEILPTDNSVSSFLH